MAAQSEAAKAGIVCAVQAIGIELDQDDQDILAITIRITNENPVPASSLKTAVNTASGRRYLPTRSVESIGPGLSRTFDFQIPASEGTWSFTLAREVDGQPTMIVLGPFDPNERIDDSRNSQKTMTGETFGSAAGGDLLGSFFGDAIKPLGSETSSARKPLVSIAAATAIATEGGEMGVTSAKDLLGKVKVQSSSGHTTTHADKVREAPLPASKKPEAREAPTVGLARTSEGTMAHQVGAESVRDAPTETGSMTVHEAPTQLAYTQADAPMTSQAKTSAGPQMGPLGGPPMGQPPKDAPTGPPGGPPMGQPPKDAPTGPPGGPPMGQQQGGAPTGPPGGPPMGQQQGGAPTGPPSGPPMNNQ